MLLGVVATAASIPAFAQRQETVTLHRDDVVPVIFQSNLDFEGSRAGDRFSADVTEASWLPRGTHLEGKVVRVQKKREDRPGYMDLQFTEIYLPDGTHQHLNATPVPLTKDTVSRGKDGRFEAKKGIRKDNVVIGSVAGGLVLGAILKKPFEGAFLGALAGIVLAETDKDHVEDGNVVIRKGMKVGALINDEMTVSYDSRYNRYGEVDRPYDRDDQSYDRSGYDRDGYDRYGYNRDNHYDRAHDRSRNNDDDRDRPVYDRDGYDQYGYNRNGDYSRSHDRSRDNGVERPVYDRDGYDQNGYNRNGDYSSSHDQNRNGVGASRSLSIEVDGKALRFTSGIEPYRTGSTVMVPLQAVARQLHYEVRQDRNADVYFVEDENDSLRVEQDSKVYRLNDRRGTLPHAVESRDGILYVPLEAITVLTRADVYVGGNRYGN